MAGLDQIHAVAVALAVDMDGPLAGVLILGPAGSGKSALAVSLIGGCPFSRTALVADDIVNLHHKGGRLTASAPEPIKGLIEIRGFGPTPVRSVADCRIVLALDLEGPFERMPPASRYQPPGGNITVPLYHFKWAGAQFSAADRLRLMTASILGGQSGKRTQDSESG